MNTIESLVATYKRAVPEKDINAFTSIFDERVPVFDMWQWSYNGITSRGRRP